MSSPGSSGRTAAGARSTPRRGSPARSPSSSCPSSEPRATMAEEAVAEAPAAPPQEVTMGGLVARSIGAQVASMKEHEAGLRAGQDPDHVRKTRVAVRRLRSNLRTFEEFLEAEKTKPILEELGVLASELGGVRDREVLAGRIRAGAKVLPEADRRLVEELLQVLEEEIRVPRVSAVAYLDSERFTKLF